MRIYVSHSREFDFRQELYQPLQMLAGVEWILPHLLDERPYPVRELLRSGTLSLVLAEVSYPSTGQGIELAWAHAEGLSILCLHRQGVRPSGSLQVLCHEFIAYDSSADLTVKLKPRLGVKV